MSTSLWRRAGLVFPPAGLLGLLGLLGLPSLLGLLGLLGLLEWGRRGGGLTAGRMVVRVVGRETGAISEP